MKNKARRVVDSIRRALFLATAEYNPVVDVTQVIYCDHLRERLKLREIDEALPRQIIHKPERVSRDFGTGYQIAVARVPYLGGEHWMMVAFEVEGDVATAITIHPLDEREIEAKMTSGRWQL